MSSTTAPLDLRNRLNQEWEKHFGHQPRLFGVLGECTPDELLLRIKNSEKLVQDQILHVLVTMAHEGSKDAGRVVWQSLLPVAVRMSRRVHTLGDFGESDKISFAVGEAWQVIMTYPLHRQTHVAANLSMELLRRLTRLTPNQRHIEEQTITASDAQLDQIIGEGEFQPASAEAQLIHLFTWALNVGVIDRAGISLLSRVALGEEATAEIAEDLGVSTKCLQKRIERVRTRLSNAVRHEVTIVS